MLISIKVIAEKNFRGSKRLQEEAVVNSGDTFAKKDRKECLKEVNITFGSTHVRFVYSRA